MTCCGDNLTTLAPVKRGDTFILACIYKQNGIPADLTQYSIRAQVRDSSGDLIEELDVTKANQALSPGAFAMSAVNPPDWPIDTLQCDIQFMEETTIRSTQTFYIPVQEDVTK